MSLDSTIPVLPPNASQESGGNLDAITRALLQQPVPQQDDDGSPIISLSPASIDALEAILRQLIAATTGAVGSPGPALNVPVGAQSVLALPANPGRKGLCVANVGTGQTVSLCLNGGPAVANAGMILFPNTWWWMDRYSFTTGPVFAIASAAGAGIAIQEFN